MQWLQWLARGLRNMLRGSRLDREIDDEIAFHLHARTRALIAQGLSPTEAARRARLEFGGVAAVKEWHRDVRGVPFVDHLTRDVAYAWRSLRRTPSLLVTCVLSLGLGIGLNTTLFGALSAVFLYEPTVRDPDRTVWVETGNSNQWSYLNFCDLRESGIFEDVLGYRPVRLAWRSVDRVQRVNGLAVTANFFDGLGVGASRGRTFTSAEAEPERDARFVVLSHAFWARHFDSDLNAIGRALMLNGHVFEVTGILPADYRPLVRMSPADVYVPLSVLVYPTLHRRDNANALAVVGRLRSEMTREQAQARVTALDERLERSYPDENEGMSRRPAPVRTLTGMDALGGSKQLFVIPVILLILFGLVWLIACANVAGLLLARSVTRRQELALRSALGATKGRLIQGLLVESALLSGLGGAAAMVCTNVARPFLRSFVLPVVGPVSLDLEGSVPLYAYGVALAVISGFVCGLVPALLATRTGLVTEIQRGSGHSTTGRLWPRHALVVAQVTASVALLVIASLFLRSLMRIATLDPGFHLDNQLVATVDLDAARSSDPARALYAEQIVDRLSALPAVYSASAAEIIPLGADASSGFAAIEGRTDAAGVRISLNSVGPGYLHTLGIRLLRGREFTAGDRMNAPRVVVVNQTFAQRAFGADEALGQRIRVGAGAVSEIVGIASDSTYRYFGEEPRPMVYLAYAQRPVSSQVRPLTIHLRVGQPTPTTRAIREAVADIDRNAVVEIQTLREAIGTEATLRHMASTLLAALGGLGLILAMVGLHGVTSYVVASRTSEIGVRMALGASPRRVKRAVLGYALKLVVCGIVAGSALSQLAMRPLAALLAGLSPLDPFALAAAALIPFIVGLFASYGPARLATKVDPAVALRSQ